MTARYQFLPWVRQGATRVFKNANSARAGALPQRRKAAQPVPGELEDQRTAPCGRDPAHVRAGRRRSASTRASSFASTRPPYSADFEPNYLACIEFDPPDFPWLFTPAAAGQKGRLRPWLVLIVVQVSEEVRLESAAGRLLPSITAPVSELPDLVESWAWAHGQVVQPEPSQPPVGDILAVSPIKTCPG